MIHYCECHDRNETISLSDFPSLWHSNRPHARRPYIERLLWSSFSLSAILSYLSWSFDISALIFDISRSIDSSDFFRAIVHFLLTHEWSAGYLAPMWSFVSWPCLVSGKISRHQTGQRQNVASAGIWASRGYDGIALIRISNDFNSSFMRMRKRHFTA